MNQKSLHFFSSTNLPDNSSISEIPLEPINYVNLGEEKMEMFDENYPSPLTEDLKTLKPPKGFVNHKSNSTSCKYSSFLKSSRTRLLDRPNRTLKSISQSINDLSEKSIMLSNLSISHCIMLKNEDQMTIEEEQPKSKSSRIKGVIFVLLGVMIYSIWNFLSKYAYTASNGSLGALQQFYIKSLTYLFISFIGLKLKGVPIVLLNKNDISLVCSRAILGICENLFYLWSLIHLTVSTATTLYFVYPIITIIAARIVLKEKITKIDCVAVILSLSGVIMILHPSFLFHSDESSSSSDRFFILVVLFSASCVGFLYCIYKKTSTSLSYFTITFYYGLICSIALPIISLWTSPITSIDLMSFLLISALSSITLLGSLLIYIGFQYENAGRLATVTYAQIVFTFLIDVFICGTKFKLLNLMGVGLILSSSLVLAISKCRTDSK